MNILVIIFQDLGTFSKYASGVDSSLDLNDLYSSGITAKKRIETVITPEVLGALLAEPIDSPLFEALRSAMANMTMATQIVFDSINRRKNNIDVYKYELEAMKRSYLEIYSSSMDTIIQLLMIDTVVDGDITSAALWQKSRYYRILSSCQIKSTDEFDSIYPIDFSYLFFFRIVPLQKESLDERLSVYFSKLNDDNRSSLENSLKLALAKKTIAKALRRFDVLEFPPTIRNLFDDNHSTRTGKDENDIIMTLSDRLDGEAETLISNADALLSSSETTDFSSYSVYNFPEDNIIMMP